MRVAIPASCLKWFIGLGIVLIVAVEVASSPFNQIRDRQRLFCQHIAFFDFLDVPFWTWFFVCFVQETCKNKTVVSGKHYLVISKSEQMGYLLSEFRLVVCNVFKCAQLLFLTHFVYISIIEYKTVGSNAIV